METIWVLVQFYSEKGQEIDILIGGEQSEHTSADKDESSCDSKNSLILSAMKMPSIPEKQKHIDLIRRKVWIKQENIQTQQNIQQGPSKIMSNVRDRRIHS